MILKYPLYFPTSPNLDPRLLHFDHKSGGPSGEGSICLTQLYIDKIKLLNLHFLPFTFYRNFHFHPKSFPKFPVDFEQEVEENFISEI